MGPPCHQLQVAELIGVDVVDLRVEQLCPHRPRRGDRTHAAPGEESRRTPGDLCEDVPGEPPGRYGPHGEERGDVVAQLRTNGHRVVEAHLNGDSVKALTGSMVAYEGKVQFKKASFGGGEGVMKTLKRKATGESLDLMECVGLGVVYLAQLGPYIELIALAGDQLSVESSALAGLRVDPVHERHLRRHARDVRRPGVDDHLGVRSRIGRDPVRRPGNLPGGLPSVSGDRRSTGLISARWASSSRVS